VAGGAFQRYSEQSKRTWHCNIFSMNSVEQRRLRKTEAAVSFQSVAGFNRELH
jgi:hypothetical protein